MNHLRRETFEFSKNRPDRHVELAVAPSAEIAVVLAEVAVVLTAIGAYHVTV